MWRLYHEQKGCLKGGIVPFLQIFGNAYHRFSAPKIAVVGSLK
ncbi:MAG: hypothetical protein Q4B82_07630 [Alysiella sp.]|nr:hypothetical protein [Alysiella sp.]MDO4434432.1 hypothetical protein [Alysiella sp.]